MTPGDLSEYESAKFYNKLGVGCLFLSFMASFVFSRRMATHKEKQTKHFIGNLGQSLFSLYFFMYGTWKRASVEESLINKYLWVLND